MKKRLYLIFLTMLILQASSEVMGMKRAADGMPEEAQPSSSKRARSGQPSEDAQMQDVQNPAAVADAMDMPVGQPSKRFETTAVANLAGFLSGTKTEASALTQRIAGTWIRNASSYIFHDDLRSFLEIVVNACDATNEANGNPESVVGKFGMGFFSIFTFLHHKETSGAIIKLTTIYKNNKSGMAERYTLQFSKKEATGDININFSDGERVSSQGQTGTCIEIIPNKNKFSDETIIRIRNYIHYLDFYPHIRTKLSFQTMQNQGREVVGGQPDAKEIYVELTPERLVVMDGGFGISPDLALNTLLIPSSSGKRRSDLSELRRVSLLQDQPLPQFVQWNGKNNPGESHFLITVNGVVVLDRILPHPISNGQDIQDMVMPLPQATQLTLARDELAITADGRSFEEAIIKKIIDQSIYSALTVEGNKQLLVALYLCLNAWEDQTAAHHIKGRFSSYFKTKLNEVIEQNRVIPVPEKSYAILERIKIAFPQMQSQLIPLPAELVNYSFHKFEQFLEDFFREEVRNTSQSGIMTDGIDGKIISGKKIFFLPSGCLPLNQSSGRPVVTDLGLSTTLFVDESEMDKALASKYQKKSLGEVLSGNIAPLYSRQPLASPENASGDKVIIISNTNNSKGLFEYFPLHECEDYLIDFITEEDYEKISPNNVLKFIIDKGKYNDFELLSDKMQSALFELYKVDKKYKKFNLLLQVLLGDYGIIPFYNKQDLIKKRTDYWQTRKSDFFNSAGDMCLRDMYNRVERGQLGRDEYDRAFSVFKECLTSKRYNEFWEPYGKYTNYSSIDKELRRMDSEFTREQELIEKYNPNSSIWVIETQNIEKIWPLPANKSLELIDKLSTTLLFNLSSDNCSELESCINSGEPHVPVPEKFIKKLDYSKDVSLNLPIFFNIPGISEEAFSKIALEVKTGLSFADNHQTNLSHKFKGISVEASILPLIDIIFSCSANAQNEAITKQVRNLTSTLLNIYDYYYTLNDRDFVFSYGAAGEYFTVTPKQDVTAEQISIALDKISDNRDLMAKLIDFTIEDHLFQTSVQRRADDLSNKRLYIPSLFCNTPLSLIAKLLEQNVASEVIFKALEVAQSAEEFMITAYILFTPSVRAKLLYSAGRTEYSELQAMIASVEHLIKYYVREKLDPEMIYSLRCKLRTGTDIDQRELVVSAQPFMGGIAAFFSAFLSQQSNFEDQSGIIQDVAQQGAAQLDCNLSVLLKAHCTGKGIIELLESNNLDAANQVVAQHQVGIGSDKITQAVEAGSERAPVEASIIECLQNSIDAIKNICKNMDSQPFSNALQFRTSLMTQDEIIESVKSVDFSLGYIPNQSDLQSSHLVLSISDHVGMTSLKTLLTDLVVPDYSSKSPAQGSIGVMGNGTFKLYQATTCVYFLTRLISDPSKVFCLSITPQRNQHDLVCDLRIKCSDLSGDQRFSNFFGTKIITVFKPELHNQNIFNFLAAKNFMRDCAGATSTQVSIGNEYNPINVYYSNAVLFDEKQNISMQKEPLNFQPQERDMLCQCCRVPGQPVITIYRRINDLMQSYITTGGVPFLPLATVAKEMKLAPQAFISDLGTGLVIDIAPSMYQPVQSRTHLKMADADIQILRRLILDAFYAYTLQKGVSDTTIFDRVFTHFSSEVCSIEQLSLSPTQNKEAEQLIGQFIATGAASQAIYSELFFTNYRHQGDKSFYEHIENAVKFFGCLFNVLKEDSINELDRLIKAIKKGLGAGRGSEDARIALEQFFDCKNREIQEKISAATQEWRERIIRENKGACLIKYVVVPWIEKKVKKFKIDGFNVASVLEFKLPELKNAKEKEDDNKGEELYAKISPHQEKLLNFLNGFLEAYCQAFYECVGIRPNKIEWTAFEPYKGAFSSSAGIIKISAQSISKILKLADQILWSGADCIQRDPLYRSLFGTCPGDPGVVIHELEHVRRGSDESIHGPSTDADNNEGASFDACALSYARKAIEAGLIVKWAEKFRTDHRVDSPAYEIIKAIEQLEKVNNDLLLKKLLKIAN